LRRFTPLLLLLAVACSRGGGDTLVLDGSPRRPDAEGVVTAVTTERITLDGDRTYRVAEDLASFSTYDLIATPMLQRRGQYVQLGLDGDVAEWMAGIGVVVRAEGRDPVVFYNGDLVRIDDDRAIFKDGTVLALAEDAELPDKGGDTPGPPGVTGPARAEIDPSAHQVVVLTAQ
jgi:hypothetical protein